MVTKFTICWDGEVYSQKRPDFQGFPRLKLKTAKCGLGVPALAPRAVQLVRYGL